MADTNRCEHGGPWQPAMRAIVVAEVISAMGTQMSLLALPWFVYTTSGSATQMGVVLAAQVLPAALLGIPSAVVVQRLGSRRTMLVSDLMRGPLVAAVPLLQLMGVLTLPVLLALVFAIGLFSAPYVSAQRLLIPATFADDEAMVVRGNALLEGSVRLAMLLGPAAAGVAISVLAAANVLFIDALSYLVACVVLWRGLPSTLGGPAHLGDDVGTVPAPRASTVDAHPVEPRGVLAGIRYVAHHVVLRRISLASLAFGFFYPPLFASLPVLTAQRYAADARIAGLLYAAVGAGAVLGSLVVLRVADRVQPLRLGAVGALGLCLPLWLLVVHLSAWQFALVMLVSGVFLPMINAPVLTQVMLRAPAEVRTKVLTLVLSANLLAGPLAFALTGPALERWGLTAVYVVVALGISVASALIATLGNVPPAVPPAATRMSRQGHVL